MLENQNDPLKRCIGYFVYDSIVQFMGKDSFEDHMMIRIFQYQAIDPHFSFHDLTLHDSSLEGSLNRLQFF